MIELFSTVGVDFELDESQQIIPIPPEEDIPSLSAILMNEDYYELVLNASKPIDGLPIVTADALIPLKARAYLDLVQRRASEEAAPSRDIKKHRNDIFQLAATLPNATGPALAESIKNDLRSFLAAFPEDSSDSKAIHQSTVALLGADAPTFQELRDTLVNYFAL